MLNDVESFGVQVLNNFRDKSGSETSWSQIRLFLGKLSPHKGFAVARSSIAVSILSFGPWRPESGVVGRFRGRTYRPQWNMFGPATSLRNSFGKVHEPRKIWFDMIIGARIVRLRELGRRHVQINFKSPPSQWLRAFEAERYHDHPVMDPHWCIDHAHNSPYDKHIQVWILSQLINSPSWASIGLKRGASETVTEAWMGGHRSLV